MAGPITAMQTILPYRYSKLALRLAVFIGAAFANLVPAALASTTDCPMRNAPFSIDLPLIDILVSPAAKEVANQALGGRLAAMPPLFAETRAPAFSAIVTLRSIGGYLSSAPSALVDLDRRLKALRITDADRIARCARYDDDRPSFKLAPNKPNLLIFEKINGFKDAPSVEAAHAAFIAMGQRKGWTVVTTEKAGAFHPEILRKFDAVIWNNVSGDVLTLTQRKAMRDYIENGGAFIGVHGSGGDPVYFWDWYADHLLGARFAGHPMEPQFQDARIVLEDKESPLAAGLPVEWTMKDEWYSFASNPRRSGATIIATLDEGTYKQTGRFGERLTMGDHPIAWTNRVGKGRMFYSAIGHLPQTYSDPRYVRMLENAINWAILSSNRIH